MCDSNNLAAEKAKIFIIGKELISELLVLAIWNQFIKELFLYLADFIYVLFYTYKHAGINKYIYFLIQIFPALLLITIHLCWKANILHLLHVWLQL